MVAALVALLPGVLFLIALWLMDSFKLVRRSAIVTALAAGALAALACEALHGWILAVADLDVRVLTRYLAPVTEEAAKGVFVLFILVRRRAGFLVDAAVQGFAVGTGFAIVENAVYLRDLGEAPLMVWVVRGLGTGVLHGAATAIVAIAGKATMDRRSGRAGLAVLPGLAIAIVIHSAYNHLLVSPVAAASAVLILLPLVLVIVFERSERATREWVGAGLDLDLELLGLIGSPEIQSTRIGAFLRQLRDRFDGLIVADMLCLLRMELELAVQAKGRLIAREAGLDLPADDDLYASLAEFDYLRRSIGRTGLLALAPLRMTSHRDDWHRHLLAEAGVRARLRDTVRAIVRPGG